MIDKKIRESGKWKYGLLTLKLCKFWYKLEKLAQRKFEYYINKRLDRLE